MQQLFYNINTAMAFLVRGSIDGANSQFPAQAETLQAPILISDI
tara:strand:+ start:623 stop:754 length:132 start_codon:yes stop_codon:yes gene_type:complete